MSRRIIPKLESTDLRGEVDVAILTMREDEEDAVLKRFPTAAYCEEAGCSISYLLVEGGYFTVAITRSLRQGTNEAQKVTETLIRKLAPTWIIVVGIAGAVPDSDFTLGDVIVADRVYDLTLSASKQGKREYSLAGGSVHALVDRVLVGLRARRDELQAWNRRDAIGAARPSMSVANALYYGTAAFRRQVRESLESHFGRRARRPRFTVRPIVSSNMLVQDTNLVQNWRKLVRHFAAIEMEFGGAYIAAKGRAEDGGDIPVFTVRGISDVVGLRRQGSGDWTNYARNSAASFTRALVAGGFLGPHAPARHHARKPPGRPSPVHSSKPVRCRLMPRRTSRDFATKSSRGF